MLKGYKQASIATLKGGAVIRLGDDLLRQVIDSFNDGDAEAKKARRIVLNIEFVLRDGRESGDPESVDVYVTGHAKIPKKITDGGSLLLAHDDDGVVTFMQEEGDQGVIRFPAREQNI